MKLDDFEKDALDLEVFEWSEHVRLSSTIVFFKIGQQRDNLSSMESQIHFFLERVCVSFLGMGLLPDSEYVFRLKPFLRGICVRERSKTQIRANANSKSAVSEYFSSYCMNLANFCVKL